MYIHAYRLTVQEWIHYKWAWRKLFVDTLEAVSDWTELIIKWSETLQRRYVKFDHRFILDNRKQFCVTATAFCGRAKKSVRCFIILYQISSRAISEDVWTSVIRSNLCNLVSVAAMVPEDAGHYGEWGGLYALVMPSGEANRREGKHTNTHWESEERQKEIANQM